MTEKKEVKPFFSMFLEAMDKEAMETAKAGKTIKYPSDLDEDGTGDD
jgi:hypothetical protein